MAHLPRQDMPPPGGFAEFSFQRHIPKKGFGGLAVLGAVTGISVWGMAVWISRQKVVNENRLARIEERHVFLERLDKHMYQKYQARVQKQAELDVLAMDKLIRGEEFQSNRPPKKEPEKFEMPKLW